MLSTRTKIAGVVVLAIGLLTAAALVVVKRPHWVPVLLWRVPYSHYEAGGAGVSTDALDRLQSIRAAVGYRYRILSGYRSSTQNSKAGGASQSQHLTGIAFDVWVPHSHRSRFYEAAKTAGFTGYGWGNRTVHIDLGPRRWWTYDTGGKAMSGAAASQFLINAPGNFLEDFKLSR